MTVRILAAHRYVDGAWCDALLPADLPARDVRVLTWNVWFGGHMWEERTTALVDELARRRPDVIVLQEVTDPLLHVLADQPWIQAGYQMSDVDGTTMAAYGVLLLSRIPIRRLQIVALPSEMGRRLVVAELACGLVAATVHLESTAACAAERIEQLAIIQPYLATYPDVVLAGDMNHAPGDPEAAAVDPAFVDAWPAVRADPGYTVDTDLNVMRHAVKARESHDRIDRIFVRSTRWRPTAIERVGTEAIDVDGTFVSDHFGIEATLGVAR